MLLKKILTIVVVGGISLVVGLYAVAFAIGGPDYASRYLRSFTHSPTEPPLDWFEPTAPVRGAAGEPLPKGDPVAEGIDPKALGAAAAYAEARRSRALVVVRNGKVVFERYWRGGSPELRFNSHSFHKSIVAMLVGIAVAEGSIPSIDEPASRWLTEWAGDARNRITVRDLLQMQSGLQPPDFSLMPWAGRIRTRLTTDLARANLALPLTGTPGQTWGHHDSDSVALGVLLERATGRRYPEYLSEKLWQPLGNRDATLWLDREGGMAHTECCFLASVGDWTRVGEMLRNGGAFRGRRVLPAGWVARMQTRARGNPNYGFQLWLGSPYTARRLYLPSRPRSAPNLSAEPYAADDVFFLDGFGKRRLWIIPSAALVILREGTNPDDWDDSRIPNIILRGTKGMARARG